MYCNGGVQHVGYRAFDHILQSAIYTVFIRFTTCGILNRSLNKQAFDNVFRCGADFGITLTVTRCVPDSDTKHMKMTCENIII